MLKRLLIAAVLFCALPGSARAQVPPSARGLVVFLNMYTGDRGLKLDSWYKMETAGALFAIQSETAFAYGAKRILYRDDARVSNLVRAVRELDADPRIQAIDLIVYTHGLPDQLNVVYEGLGLLHSKTEWVPIREVTERVRAIGSRKLRAVFADSCFSSTHTDEWLEAGFKVAAGTRKVDYNQSRDLALFLSRWVAHGTFARAIDDANHEFTTGYLDSRKSDGDSRKSFRGKASLRINSPVF